MAWPARIVFCVLILAGLQAPLRAENPTLRLGGPIFPPYFEVVDGKTVGVMLDRVTAILAEAGYNTSVGLRPPPRLLQDLLAGEFDLCVIVRNPAMDASPRWISSSTSVGALNLNLYSHRDALTLKSREDLRGRAIVVMRGYSYGDLRAWLERPDNAVTLTEVNHFGAALRLVATGRVPNALLYDVNFAAAVAEIGPQTDNVVVNPFLQVPVFFYLNKEAVADPESTMRALIDSYLRLISQGRLG